jgi:hypothetical protein
MTEEQEAYQLLVTDIQSEIFPILIKYRKHGKAIKEALEWFCYERKWENDKPKFIDEEKN